MEEWASKRMCHFMFSSPSTLGLFDGFFLSLFHRTRLDLFSLSSQDIIQWDFDNCEAPLHMAALGAHVQVREKETTEFLCESTLLFPYLILCPPSLSTDAHDAARRWGGCQQVGTLRVDEIQTRTNFVQRPAE